VECGERGGVRIIRPLADVSTLEAGYSDRHAWRLEWWV
jgi:hypothetical protein